MVLDDLIEGDHANLAAIVRGDVRYLAEHSFQIRRVQEGFRCKGEEALNGGLELGEVSGPG